MPRAPSARGAFRLSQEDFCAAVGLCAWEETVADDEWGGDLVLSIKAFATDITGTLKNAPATQKAPRKTQTNEQAIAAMVIRPPNKVPDIELMWRLSCSLRCESI